jgi:hypothetical protein
MPVMRLALQQRILPAIKQFQSSNYSHEHDGPRDPDPYHCRFCFWLVRSDAIVFVIIHKRQASQRRILTSRKRAGYPSVGRPASDSWPLVSDHRGDIFVVVKNE